jgi:hypothetical protein
VERAKAALFAAVVVAYMAWVFDRQMAEVLAAIGVHIPQWLKLGVKGADTVFSAVCVVIGPMVLGAWVFVALEKRRQPRQ